MIDKKEAAEEIRKLSAQSRADAAAGKDTSELDARIESLMEESGVGDSWVPTDETGEPL